MAACAYFVETGGTEYMVSRVDITTGPTGRMGAQVQRRGDLELTN